MALMLIEAREPDEPEPERPRERRHIPVRPFLWLALICWMLAAAGWLTGLASIVATITAICLGAWRLDRWAGKQYWGGLTDHRQ